MGVFNPHTHMGCDCHVVVARSVNNSFNPHTHMGRESVQLALAA